ncbi:MAG: Bax inhibitor-1/YccA family protein [Deltaproteobacteria bacterium]|jgi:FtsH-binding integral membrane protein|nr:Bax inhibitor-1/YccA family protein [Deltaproteobacteria bacterium]
MVELAKPPLIQEQSLANAAEISFFQKVYAWMCGGLVLSAFVGYLLANSEAWYSFLVGSWSWIFIIAVQLGLVFAINFLRDKLATPIVQGLFLAYSAAVGMTLSIVILVYPSDIIFKALLCTGAVYGSMAAYGLLTKKSLQAWGGFLFMALIGLIVASIVNVFAKSPMFDYIICWLGVLIFAGLTAYDHQKLRVIFAGGFANQDVEAKIVIMGALELFLDFINLFLFFVRILGSRD